MSCTNPAFWSPVPVGSKVVVSGSGAAPDFNVVVAVGVNGVHVDTWRHKDVVPGPKSRAVGAGERCIFNILLDVFSAPAAGSAIKIMAHLELPDGKIDPNRNCTFSFTHAGHFPILLIVTT